MALRSFGRALKTPLPCLFIRPLSQRRTLISAGGYVNAHEIAQRKPLGGSSLLFSRGMKTIDFAGHKETVYGKYKFQLVVYLNAYFQPEREDWPRDKLLVRLSSLPFLIKSWRYRYPFYKRAHFLND